MSRDELHQIRVDCVSQAEADAIRVAMESDAMYRFVVNTGRKIMQDKDSSTSQPAPKPQTPSSPKPQRDRDDDLKKKRVVK